MRSYLSTSDICEVNGGLNIAVHRDVVLVKTESITNDDSKYGMPVESIKSTVT